MCGDVCACLREGQVGGWGRKGRKGQPLKVLHFSFHHSSPQPFTPHSIILALITTITFHSSLSLLSSEFSTGYTTYSTTTTNHHLFFLTSSSQPFTSSSAPPVILVYPSFSPTSSKTHCSSVLLSPFLTFPLYSTQRLTFIFRSTRS